MTKNGDATNHSPPWRFGTRNNAAVAQQPSTTAKEDARAPSPPPPGRPADRRQRPGSSYTARERSALHRYIVGGGSSGGTRVVQPSAEKDYSRAVRRSDALSVVPVAAGAGVVAAPLPHSKTARRPHTAVGGGNSSGVGGRDPGGNRGVGQVYITELLPPASVDGSPCGTNGSPRAQTHLREGTARSIGNTPNRGGVCHDRGGSHHDRGLTRPSITATRCQLVLPTTVSLSLGGESSTLNNGNPRRARTGVHSPRQPLSARYHTHGYDASRSGEGRGASSDGGSGGPRGRGDIRPATVGGVAGIEFYVRTGGRGRRGGGGSSVPYPPASRGFRRWRPGEESSEYKLREVYIGGTRGAHGDDQHNNDGPVRSTSPPKPHQRRESPLGLGYRTC